MEIQVLPRLHSPAGGSLDETPLQGYDLVQQLLRTVRDNRERRKERTRNSAEEMSLQHATNDGLLEVSTGVLCISIL